jgi:DNA-binding MarR family transcriptional regulator
MTNRSEEPKALGEVLEFMSGLWSLDHALHARSKAMLKESGVTGPQRLALRIIGLFPGLTFGQLAARLHIHPSTLSGIVKRLETQALVIRSADPEDARRGRLSLTPLGEERSKMRARTVEEAVSTVLARTAPAHIQTARALILDLASELVVRESPKEA